MYISRFHIKIRQMRAPPTNFSEFQYQGIFLCTCRHNYKDDFYTISRNQTIGPSFQVVVTFSWMSWSGCEVVATYSPWAKVMVKHRLARGKRVNLGAWQLLHTAVVMPPCATQDDNCGMRYYSHSFPPAIYNSSNFEELWMSLVNHQEFPKSDSSCVGQYWNCS